MRPFVRHLFVLFSAFCVGDIRNGAGKTIVFKSNPLKAQDVQECWRRG